MAAAPPELTNRALPKALAPAWARLAIGGMVAAPLAGPVIDALGRMRKAEFQVVGAALAAGLGFIAALAADLDRRRPRAGLAAGIAAIFAGATFLAIAGGSVAPIVGVVSAILGPFLAGALRAAAGGEPRPLVRGCACLAFTTMLVIVPPALFFAAFLRSSFAVPFGEVLAGAWLGMAATGGLIAAGYARRDPWPALGASTSASRS